MHTSDDFLRAIEAEPGDRTRRLVFADWLDERADPRGELIRVEEEMRTLPVFADRFWELKPRRNELRESAGPEWCGRMRYGTECEPVFRHGVPDGWRERWRLIREFAERWHRIPMPDVGGRQKDIAEAEARLGRKLPPSVREWIAFLYDVRQRDCSLSWLEANDAQAVPDQAAASLWWSRDPTEGRQGGDSHFAVQFQSFDQPDPPVGLYHEDVADVFGAAYGPIAASWADSVTAFALDEVLAHTRGEGGFFAEADEVADLTCQLSQAFPSRTRAGKGEWYETDNLFIRVERVEPRRGRNAHFQVIARVAKSLSRDQIPAFLWVYVRDNPFTRGIFASQEP
jgi:uncharacterized protein (TIGR02996 family)